MISLIMGLPGAGKGTQAELLQKEYNMEHLSTGNLFRNITKESSDLAKEIKGYIDAGDLVPDDVTAKLLESELKKEKYAKGFLLDGFPRNLNQAKVLDELFTKMNIKIDNIIFLDIDKEIIVKRLSNRLTCPNCQATYHKINNKPKQEGICDVCGTKLIQRVDDEPERIENRMEIAKSETLPVIDFYKTEYNVIEIDAQEKTIDVVFKEIKDKVNNG